MSLNVHLWGKSCTMLSVSRHLIFYAILEFSSRFQYCSGKNSTGKVEFLFTKYKMQYLPAHICKL